MDAYARLDTLARSQEQDIIVRRLLDAGLEVTALDSGTPSQVILFRDRNNELWIVRRNGIIDLPGQTNWSVTSEPTQEPRRPTPLRAR